MAAHEVVRECKYAISHEEEDTSPSDWYCGKFDEWDPNCSYQCPCFKRVNEK